MGTRGWNKASSRSTAPGSAPRFCSVTDGDERIVLPSRLFTDLMFGTDPGDLPGARHRQAGMRSASISAWQHSGLASRRVPLLPGQIRGIQFILWLALTGSALKPRAKGSFANQTHDDGDLEGNTQGKMLYLVNLLPFDVRHFRICKQEKQNHSFTKQQDQPKTQPWEGKLLGASPFPIILVKYAAWESTQA